MSKDLILIRGGQDASTFARMMVENFVSEVGYVDSYGVNAKQDVLNYMNDGIPTIIVYGTFTTLHPYFDVANQYGYTVTTLTCEMNDV